ncbi:MAG: hypothetical protein QOF31_154 [Mycobacterium sp.]|nr:hypothetical protein [Mycobacterium sp.]
MARERLFDDIQRYGGPALYSEPHFGFLNRAADPAWQRVRDVLESWYAEHPDPNGGLRARFPETPSDYGFNGFTANWMTRYGELSPPGPVFHWLMNTLSSSSVDPGEM